MQLGTGNIQFSIRQQLWRSERFFRCALEPTSIRPLETYGYAQIIAGNSDNLISKEAAGW